MWILLLRATNTYLIHLFFNFILLQLHLLFYDLFTSSLLEQFSLLLQIFIWILDLFWGYAMFCLSHCLFISLTLYKQVEIAKNYSTSELWPLCSFLFTMSDIIMNNLFSSIFGEPKFHFSSKVLRKRKNLLHWTSIKGEATKEHSWKKFNL